MKHGVKILKEIKPGINTYWYQISNQRKYFDHIASQLKIKTPEEWYSIPYAKVKKYPQVVRIVSQYKHSFWKTLQALYPEVKWNPLRWQRAPPNHWKDKQNQREYFESIASDLGIQKVSDWFKVTTEQITKYPRATSILCQYYNTSLVNAIQTLYPELQFDPTSTDKFVPQDYWKEKEHQRQYLDWVASQLNITSFDGWYSMKHSQLKVFPKVNSILGYYNGSLTQTLKEVYPEVEWNPTGWKRVPQSHWNLLSNQKSYFDSLALEMHLKTPEDWYQHASDIYRNQRVESILKAHYSGSLCKALQAIYPEVNWKPWRFNKLPKLMWKDASIVRNFLEDVSTQLGITELSQWLYHSGSLRGVAGGSSLLAFHDHSMKKVLAAAYPEKNLSHARMTSVEKRVVEWLSLLFNNSQILRFHKFDFGELDFYLPEYSLAFEVQGQHHYHEGYTGGLKSQMMRDEYKRMKCKEAGITLIEISYWWDGSLNSIINQINQLKPEIFSNNAKFCFP